MDTKIIIGWLIPIIARGVAWILAAKLGMTAAESDGLATQAASAIGALVLVVASVWTSVKGRKKLLQQEPPK